MAFSLFMVVVHPFLNTNRFELLDDRPFPALLLAKSYKKQTLIKTWIKTRLIINLQLPFIFFKALGCLGIEAL
jgi:hypothetical protein